MEESNTLNILKNAFLMEQQGKNLYQKAAENAQSSEVKLFFQNLVDDEQEHMDILEKQFKAYMENKKFVSGEYENDNEADTAPIILDDSLIDKINAAGFEATAITAAISFEKRAVDLYGSRSEQTSDPEEKKLYKWLSAWETIHLNRLMAIEKSLIEKVWDDNNFWPF
ncbi:MAG: ferritin family protein [Desulfobacteraceae bacterium]|nr:ferritin family protein [Desulfobacteraceae bacterium]